MAIAWTCREHHPLCRMVTTQQRTLFTELLLGNGWCIVAYYVVIARGKKKLHGRSPRANYTDRATAACRRSDCQLLRTEGATWST
jgi:hypothetical protein